MEIRYNATGSKRKELVRAIETATGAKAKYLGAPTMAYEIDYFTVTRDGTLAANIIKAGVLSSQDGSSWWDLETGEVHLRAYATTEQIVETNERITEIEDKKMYRLVITSSNGNIFKNSNIQTTLSAIVFSWDENVTDSLDPNQFIWTRVSDDPVADAVWNNAHFGGTKSIVITKDDVNVKATFFCDLIDTTTRNSLLG